jgi:hypothetical protein
MPSHRQKQKQHSARTSALTPGMVQSADQTGRSTAAPWHLLHHQHPSNSKGINYYSTSPRGHSHASRAWALLH